MILMRSLRMEKIRRQEIKQGSMLGSGKRKDAALSQKAVGQLRVHTRLASRVPTGRSGSFRFYLCKTPSCSLLPYQGMGGEDQKSGESAEDGDEEGNDSDVVRCQELRFMKPGGETCRNARRTPAAFWLIIRAFGQNVNVYLPGSTL